MSRQMTQRARSGETSADRTSGRAPFWPPSGANVQRKCADCASSDTEQEVQTKLAIGASGDSYEREADAVADRIMSGGTAAPRSGAGISRIQRMPGGRGRPSGPGVSQSRIDARRGTGQPLPGTSRQFFEPRMGADLSSVRIHSDAEAQVMAKSINARAFTYGSDIYFGAGHYSPNTPKGQHLMAHELTHTVQQRATKQVQRAEIEILDARHQTVPNTNQRQAAASCDIDCSGVNVGIFHAMPTFFHSSRGSVLPSAAGANGIGAALHFLRNSTAIPEGNACAACTDWKVIQVIHSNEPADSRGKEWFVDNSAGATPFYDDGGLSGSGTHNIPTNYVDAGEKITTTKSIYDRPYRPPANLAIVTGKDFFWRAQAHITCVKPGKDKVLGGIGYGFTRKWNSANNSHDEVVAEGPTCLGSPGTDFVKTLKSDTSTSSYKFET